MNFDFKNGCKNEFKDNNEKSRSWSRTRVSHIIDFKAQSPRNGHADSVGVNKTGCSDSSDHTNQGVESVHESS